MTTLSCLELPLVFAGKMSAEGNTVVFITFFKLMESLKYTVSCLIQHRGVCGVFPLFVANYALVRGIVVLLFIIFLFLSML